MRIRRRILRPVKPWLLYFNCVFAVVWVLSVSLPHGALGNWSVVCDCDISWSYSLALSLFGYSSSNIVF